TPSASSTPTRTGTPTVTPTATMTPTVTNTPLPSSTPTSTSTPFCGNGIVESGETCDPPGSVQPPDGNVCRADCTFCGDGVVNGPVNKDDPGYESCDAGGVFNRGCHADCSGRLTKDPATIRFSTNGPDRLQVNGRIITTEVLDGAALVMGV